MRKILEFVKNLLKDIYLYPERAFLVLALVFGTVLVFLVPPMQAPDEQAHMFKAYQTSEGFFWPETKSVNGVTSYGHTTPKSLIAFDQDFRVPVAGRPEQTVDPHLFKEYGSRPLNPSDRQYRDNSPGNTYSPVLYLPQALGMAVIKPFNPSTLAIFWTGRLFNLFFWVAILYASIKLLPFAKWAFVVLALNPLTLTLVASYSGDATSIALAALFIALTFKLIAFDATAHKKYLWILLATVSVLLALSKPTSVPLLFLLLFIPWRVISRNRFKSWGIIFAIFVAALGIAIVWNRSIAPIASAGSQLMRPGVVDTHAQIQNIIHQPVEFIKVIVKNYVTVDPGTYGDSVLMTYMGVYGWLDTQLPLWAQIIYFLALFLAVLFQFGRGVVFGWRVKMATLTAFFAMGFGSILAMYLGYSAVGSKTVDGVQGRYFIPVAPVLLGLFTARKKLIDNYEKQYIFTVILIVSLVAVTALIEIARRYY